MTVTLLPEYINTVVVDNNGKPSPFISSYLDQQHQVVSEVVEQHNQGMQMPGKTTAEITTLAADTSVPNGTLWFNSTTGKLQFKTGAGTIETITSS